MSLPDISDVFASKKKKWTEQEEDVLFKYLYSKNLSNYTSTSKRKHLLYVDVAKELYRVLGLHVDSFQVKEKIRNMETYFQKILTSCRLPSNPDDIFYHWLKTKDSSSSLSSATPSPALTPVNAPTPVIPPIVPTVDVDANGAKCSLAEYLERYKNLDSLVAFIFDKEEHKQSLLNDLAQMRMFTLRNVYFASSAQFEKLEPHIVNMINASFKLELC